MIRVNDETRQWCGKIFLLWEEAGSKRERAMWLTIQNGYWFVDTIKLKGDEHH